MKLKKFLALAVALTTALTFTVCLLAACGSSDDTSKAEAEQTQSTTNNTEPDTEPETDKEPETDEEWQEAMVKKALVSYGNTVMVQNVIKKAQAGDEVNIAYLGGSITEGFNAGANDCYAKLTFDHFAEKFGTGDNVKYHNAGIAGTPSQLGILRLDRDILSADPDLVFIEFAVNDGSGADYENAYESIVQTLLKRNIAVVLLFAVTENGHSAQDYMKPIGEAYRLPMISYCDAVNYLREKGRITWQDFSDDDVHPDKRGHKMVADMINYYFDTVMDVEPEGEFMMPFETVYSPREIDAHMYENDTLTPTDLGSWSVGSDVGKFTSGWRHSESSGNDPIVFEMDAKFVYLVYKQVATGNYGKIHIKVEIDGELYDEKDHEVVDPSGWGNPIVLNIGMNPTTAHYRIELSMAEGDEDKQAQALAFGYTE